MTEPQLTKAILPESQMPTEWYNLAADFPEPLPPHLNPQTEEPLKPEEMEVLFAPGLVEQEFSSERYINIPEPVRDVYRLWRPSPLSRARRLEEKLGTSARIYYKNESVSPIGSHKPNTSVPQAFYNQAAHVEKLTTETGAGQWGSALAFAGEFFDLEVEVWQVRSSFDSKPYRRMLMHTYGATVHPSPSSLTKAGRSMLERFPDTTGSLGMAVSEAIEAAVENPIARYALGSVLNHVMLHQTIIGLETQKQLRMFGEQEPDYVFACAGGGSNLAGLTFPFIGSNIRGETNSHIIAVEPTKCPTLTQGDYRYDFGDVMGMTPLLKMYTLGRDFVPDPIHAGGLRYHGMAPMVSHAVHLGLMTAITMDQDRAFKAGIEFARSEGTIPAPESNHAIAAALDEASRHTGTPGSGPSIVIGLSGNGFLDLPAYESYLH